MPHRIALCAAAILVMATAGPGPAHAASKLCLKQQLEIDDVTVRVYADRNVTCKSVARLYRAWGRTANKTRPLPGWRCTIVGDPQTDNIGRVRCVKNRSRAHWSYS